MKTPQVICISRTDSIGDVMLTLPLTGFLKQKIPNVKIIFLGNPYTKPVLKACNFIDEVLEWKLIESMSESEQILLFNSKNIDVFIHVFPKKEIARLVKKTNIKYRIGTSHRSYNLLTCNKLVNFTRKKSELHEAQLNFKLLKPLGFSQIPSLSELPLLSGFYPSKKENIIVSKESKNIILHTLSQGSAVEWPMEKFYALAENLADKGYHVYFTGTEKEGSIIKKGLPKHKNIYDVTGKMTLSELNSFIVNCDMLVAASTGPIHIASLGGINVIGLYSERKPIHPGRWQPIGERVSIITGEEKASLNGKITLSISVDEVVSKITELFV